MRFSIIVPTFNSERYLGECLESLRQQTYGDFEVIIVDDGSEDASKGISESFILEMGGGVTLLRGPHEGSLLARRRGILCAKGEYLVFVDSDDALRRDALEVIASAIDRFDADIISYGYSREADFSCPYRPVPLQPGMYVCDQYQIIKQCVCSHLLNNLWNKAVRRSCIDLDAPYDAYRGMAYGEDLFQLLPIIDGSSSLLHLEDALYYYRPNASSHSSRYRSSHLPDIARVQSRVIEYAKRWGDSCYEEAVRREVTPYVGLLRIAEESLPDADRRAAFEEIRSAMQHEGVFERSHGRGLRLDKRLLFDALRDGDYRRARLVMRAVGRARRLLRS